MACSVSQEHTMKWVVLLGDGYKWPLPWYCTRIYKQHAHQPVFAIILFSSKCFRDGFSPVKKNYSNFMSQINRRLLSLYMIDQKANRPDWERATIFRGLQFSEGDNFIITHIFCILVFLCKTVLQANEWPVNEPKWPLSSQWDFICTLNWGEMTLFYCKHNPRCNVTLLFVWPLVRLEYNLLLT